MLPALTVFGLPTYEHMTLIAIVAVLALPLIFNPPESLLVVPALAFLFLFSFTGPFLDVYGHYAMAAAGIAVAIGLIVALGFRARSGGTAFAAGAGFVLIAWLAIGYAIYEARETGWHGLTEISRPTDDQTGISKIWFVYFAAFPVWFIGAFAWGALAVWAHSRFR